jgi:streptomycin 6-kinase
MTERDVPDYFATFIADYFGERGAAWLVELPGLLATYARRWGLELLRPFAGLSFHYVAPVVRTDGSPAVLKVGVPEEESRTGIAFLRLCNGDGAVCLLEADAEYCALLMERALPGSPLTRLDDDDEATEIAAEVMRALWRPVPATHSFILVERRLRAFARVREMHGGGAGPLPEWMLSRAEGLAVELLASAPYERVLHGDLHHDNIVAAQRAPWLAIDPKGIVGDPGFETGALMNNPYGRMETWKAPARQFAHRAAILAERLGYPRERILAWTYTQAVLSASWEVLAGTVRYASWVARAEVVATLL